MKNVQKVFQFRVTRVESKRCTLCDTGDTCDEIHLLFKCSFLYTERENLLGRRVFSNINIYTIQKFLSTKSKKNLLKLARFMTIIMSLFK